MTVFQQADAKLARPHVGSDVPKEVVVRLPVARNMKHQAVV